MEALRYRRISIRPFQSAVRPSACLVDVKWSDLPQPLSVGCASYGGLMW